MSDALTMAGRSLRLSLRSPDVLLTALLLPVMLMVVFVYLFGGAVAIGTSYIEYVVPGVLLLCAVTGAATTAVTVCQDMTTGIIDRFRSLDVPGTVVLTGHVTASLLRNVVSTALVAAVAVGLGFRPPPHRDITIWSGPPAAVPSPRRSPPGAGPGGDRASWVPR
jgi:ABC-2 type transport system permease protein